MVAELKSYQAPILADFWAAYQLRFIADGDLLIEAYPWQFIRTYNAIPREAMERRCLWLVHEKAIGEMKKLIAWHAHPGSWEQRPVYTLHTPLLFRQFEYWELGGPTTPKEWQERENKAELNYYLWELDPHESVRLMNSLNPRYFTTPYPPRP